MQKIADILILSLLVCLVYLSVTAEPPLSTSKQVDERMQRTYDRFTQLMTDNSISVDYTKITAIHVALLPKTMIGVFDLDTGALYISTNTYPPPSYMLITPEKEKRQLLEDYLLAILAHEIMHSQGVAHETDAPTSLMAETDLYIVPMIKIIGVEELILNSYRRLDELKECYPAE